MKKPLLIFLLIFTVTLIVQTKAVAQYLVDDGSSNPMTLQINAGSQGFGAELRMGFGSIIAARLGGNFLPLSFNNIYKFGGFNGSTTATAKINNIHLLADVTPVENLQWLRVVAGAAYLYKATGSYQFIPGGTYSIGNYNITAAELGQLNISSDWKGVAPYFGIGLFKSFPSDVFNINLDIGTYYLTQPTSHIVGTNLLSDNYKLEPQFNENIKSYRWLPVLQLNFNFKIRN